MYRYKADSEQQIKSLSSLIYKLMYPPNFEPSGEENYLFGWEYDGENWVMIIPENYECPIFIKPEFDSVIQQIGSILNTNLEPGEGAAIVEYLKTGNIILNNIIPKYFKNNILP